MLEEGFARENSTPEDPRNSIETEKKRPTWTSAILYNEKYFSDY